MSPRPTIFISAVSKELKSSRQLVSNTLQFLGYEPVWQDVFGAEQGDVRAMLREKIDACQGVVQLVGKCYGVEPPSPDEQFGRVSYTQYEALYARSRGKKVWYLFLDDNFPGDTHESELEESRELQAAYRKRLASETHLFHQLNSREALEASVLKLRDDLTRLRRGFRQWAVAVVALLVLLGGLVFWVLNRQHQQTQIIQKQGEQVGTLVEHYQKMEQALASLADKEARVGQAGEKLGPEEVRTRAYAMMERELGLNAGTLAREMPGFALELYNRSDASLHQRALAAYALNKLEEAAQLNEEAIAQEDKVQQNADLAKENSRKRQLANYVLAGQTSDKRIRFADAVKYYRKAEKLTDRNRDPLEWADGQWNIAYELDKDGKYAESAATYAGALEEFRRVHGENDEEVLTLRNNLANVMVERGNLAAAEAEFKAILPLREKLLGPENPSSIDTHNNLALVFHDLGKFSAAETELREVVKLRTKVLGAEKSPTLMARNNLARAIDAEGRHDEAAMEFRAVIQLQEKVLSPEHPETLMTRNNLGSSLLRQGKFAEAEAEFRMVCQLREKVLSPTHPSTLRARLNLAGVLMKQNKLAEAEAEYRQVIPLLAAALENPNHPDLVGSRMNLAAILFMQDKNAEAEAEFRAVAKIQEKILPPQHLSTLMTYYNLAQVLVAENKIIEGRSFAKLAAEGAANGLGPDHEMTLKFDKYLQELQTANSPAK